MLNATDLAKPYQDQLESKALELSSRWERLYANLLTVEEFQQLAADTRGYLNEVPAQTQATSTQLLEIVMAQDFQDLTGQVIKKMMGMVKLLESELVNFLIEFSPEAKRRTGHGQQSVERPGHQSGRPYRRGQQPATGRRPAGKPGLLTNNTQN